jgi:NADPH-dependent curcumin reductase CurA
MSVDPYMRPRLNADQALNTPLLGGGIGRIIESRNPKFAEGQLVKHGLGFREVFTIEGRGLAALNRDPELPLSVYMHELGGTGMTAYGGLLEVARLKEGERSSSGRQEACSGIGRGPDRTDQRMLRGSTGSTKKLPGYATSLASTP